MVPEASSAATTLQVAALALASGGIDVRFAVTDVDARMLGFHFRVLDFDSGVLEFDPRVPGFDSPVPDVQSSEPAFDAGQSAFEACVLDVHSAVPDVASYVPDFVPGDSGHRHGVLDIDSAVPHLGSAMPDTPPEDLAILHTFDADRLYSVKDLAAVTGVSRHAIGHYVKRGLLPRTEARGPYTRYTEMHRFRLLAIARLRERKYGLAEMRAVLDDASDEDIFRLAGYELPAPQPEPPAPAPTVQPAAAPVQVPSPAPAAPAPYLPSGPDEPLAGGYRAGVARGRRLWESIAICPGVFVVVLADADTEARRVAREIERQFGEARG